MADRLYLCPRSCAKLNEMLVPEINEYYLFHGTVITNMDTIRHQGLDPRTAGSGMFGKGIYFSESSTKADQYSGVFSPRLNHRPKLCV